jgi:hypothetical protein
VNTFFKILAKSENNCPHLQKLSVNGKKSGFLIYVYFPSLNSTCIWHVGERLSAPLKRPTALLVRSQPMQHALTCVTCMRKLVRISGTMTHRASSGAPLLLSNYTERGAGRISHSNASILIRTDASMGAHCTQRKERERSVKFCRQTSEAPTAQRTPLLARVFNIWTLGRSFSRCQKSS